MENEGEVEPIVKDESEQLLEENRYKIVETSPKGRFSRVRNYIV